MNWYVYCNSDPVNYWDPSGESLLGIVVGLAIGAAASVALGSKIDSGSSGSDGSDSGGSTSTAPESRWVITRNSSLTMRSYPNGKPIGSVPRGAEVSYTPNGSVNKTDYINGHQWARVTYNGVTGWVAATYLGTGKPAASRPTAPAITNSGGYVYPLASRHTADPNTGGRSFGASRSGGRLHAGMDLITPPGTGVIAMTGGTVIDNNKGFYAGTDALIVKNNDGTVTLYGEIRSGLSAGTIITQGQTIGSVVANNASGASMLHIEYYSGTVSGSVFGGGAYRRRSDLTSPMFIQYLP
ncbi:MAG: peptidoglycan DD-metalloendopeptidase family protein [Firmicutes bacterium]|nr:peptidoglycan DD-metalloendopeptidase family protein [Bacillota bacterium]